MRLSPLNQKDIFRLQADVIDRSRDGSLETPRKVCLNESLGRLTAEVKKSLDRNGIQSKMFMKQIRHGAYFHTANAAEP